MRRFGTARVYRFRRTSTQLLLFVSMVVGIGLARTGIRVGIIWPLLILALFLAGYRRRAFRALVLAVLLGLTAGLWRGGQYLQMVHRYDQLYGAQVTITARAGEDAVYGATKQLSFAAHDVHAEDGSPLVGKLQASGFGVNAIYQDDLVELTGKLYPSRGAYQARISYAHIAVLESHPSFVAASRRKFAAGIQSALPQPVAPFVLGILIGQRSTLPDNVKQDLQHVGLTHIIAVSGYNLTILLQASRRLFDRRSKRIATGMSLGLIGLFLLLAGSSASIVRAAIVSVLSIAASYYGRSFKPLNLLALAAAITSWATPSYVWGDLSWYLSFLAFYGVMVLGPLIQARWPGAWHDNIIVAIGLESLCAELMTLPLILFVFGQFSKVGLLANVLVVGLVPLAMLLGLIAGLSGMFVASLAGWLSWPATLLANYMLGISHLLADIPGVFVEDIRFSLEAMIICYAIIAAATAVLMHKTKDQKSDTITDRKERIYKGMFA